MSKISKDFIAKAKTISMKRENHNQIYKAMKHAMEQTLRYEHSMYITDLYSKLHRLNIGTTVVEKQSEVMCRKLPQRRKHALRKMIIKWKLIDAKEILRKEQYENSREWRVQKRIIGDEDIIRQFNKIWSEERKDYRNGLKMKLRKKIDFLKEKYKQIQGVDIEIPDEINGIIIKEQEIPEEYVAEPRIYGNVNITEEEKCVL